MTKPAPVLVVIDIQKEYTTPGRSFYLETAGPSLHNAARVLAHARSNRWEVVHIRHLQDGEIFNSKSELAGFVAGFEPAAGETEIAKGDFSCYSAPRFAELMKERLERPVYVIGYGSTMCCLSTIIDGYHRGQKFTFVRDASCARRTPNFDEQSTHAYATDILTTFSKVVETSHVLAN
jgi:ureidoacrylate peracid hydrolase